LSANAGHASDWNFAGPARQRDREQLKSTQAPRAISLRLAAKALQFFDIPTALDNLVAEKAWSKLKQLLLHPDLLAICQAHPELLGQFP
jgi:hypothetical protein